MIRILITPAIEAIAKGYAKRLKDSYDPIKRLNNLRNHLYGKGGFDGYVTYIDSVIKEYDDIIIAKPTQFNDILKDVDKPDFSKTVPAPPSESSTKSRKDKDRKVAEESVEEGKSSEEKKSAEEKKSEEKSASFYSLIVDALGYDWARTHLLPEYMQQLEIRSCVYCNAQYGVSLKKEDDIYTSSYEFDHFKPKSEFPHLSTSFFNLQPSCGHCNGQKWKHDIEFNLYAEKPDELRPFSFSLEKKSLLAYLLHIDKSKLEISLTASDTKLKDSHEKRFRVSKKYESHKDEVEDLIILSRIYNSSFLQQLNNSVRQRYPMFFDRYLDAVLGFPTDETQVHKRPLTLLKQDLAKQLGLL